MSAITMPFKRVAEVVSTRVAELLYAPVFVTNERSQVIASSDPQFVGRSFDELGEEKAFNYLRVPLRIRGQSGEVIVGKPNNREAISRRLGKILIELMINEITVLDRVTNRHELKNSFILNLLNGYIDDETSLIRQARLLGMDLTPPRAVILIDAADYILVPAGSSNQEQDTSRIEQRRAQQVIDNVVNFFHLPNDTICAYIDHGEVAVLKASNVKNLANWAEGDDIVVQATSSGWANLAALKRAGNALLNRLQNDMAASISIGIGRYHPGIRGLAASYQDARAALSLGRRFQGPNRVHCLDSLGVAAFVGVADEETKVELARYLLSPLDHEPDLLTTLEVFFDENCSPSASVKRLSIHRNTLTYRLDKITSLIGLDPRRFDDAIQVRLALLVRALREEEMGEEETVAVEGGAGREA